MRLKTLKIDLDFPELKLMSEHMVKATQITDSTNIPFKSISGDEIYQSTDVLCNFLSSDFEPNGNSPENPFVLRDHENNPICLSNKCRGYQGKTFHGKQYSAYDKNLLKQASESLKDRMSIIRKIADEKFEELKVSAENSDDKRPKLFRIDIKKKPS